MDTAIRRISKEVYERAMENGGVLTDEDMMTVFTMSERCGYGIYSTQAYMDGGDYLCKYWMGESCD